MIMVMFTMCSSGSEWQDVIDKAHNNPSQPVPPSGSETPEEPSEPETPEEPESPTDPEQPEDPSEPETPAPVKSVTIGIFTDAHYAHKDNSNGRYYTASKQKVKDAVETFNAKDVDMAVSLGDIVDNEYEYYGDISAYVDKLNMPKYQVLGNHDFISPFDQVQYEKNLALVGMTDRYFSVVKNGFRLIFLDSSDIATYSHPFESEGYREAEKLLKTLKDDDESNAKKYNGAISERQQKWLEAELNDASDKGEIVICLSHIPLAADGADQYTLWNAEDIIDLIAPYKCVKAVIAGHHHEGGYADDGGLHHITLKGMVLGEENSYAVITLHEDRIVVVGYGREADKEYKSR